MDFVGILDWFKSLNKPERPITHLVNGQPFAVKVDGTLGEPVHPVYPKAPVATPVLELSTLTGLVDTYNADIDGFSSEGAVAVQVESYNSVAIVSLAADEFGRRHVWARATSAVACPLFFGTYLTSEEFLIKAQASFMPIDGNYTAMLALCSSLKSGSSVQVADDGFSQNIVASVGGVQAGAVTVPPRIGLRAYRSFREIDPVESDFLLRFKAEKDALPMVALFPVDAGRWKIDTAEAVGHWLKGKLPKDAIVIA